MVNTGVNMGTTRVQAAWKVLAQVPDPEVPAISVCDLGIVREIVDAGEVLEVMLTPTYSGCPATEVIEQSVVEAIRAAGLGPVRICLRRAPAWTTDWISARGRQQLKEYGIAPPVVGAAALGAAGERPLRFERRRAQTQGPACPRCESADTELLANFGSTACKSLYRCVRCREPFEYFKPI
jgi:ring-1,2-phenylacetyl-CoA epoxidase subunit PaaD